MLRRANDLTARARARIRAAREHDPHAWPEFDGERMILVHGDPEPIDFVQDPNEYDDPDTETDAGTRDGASRPPLGVSGAGRPRTPPAASASRRRR